MKINGQFQFYESSGKHRIDEAQRIRIVRSHNLIRLVGQARGLSNIRKYLFLNEGGKRVPRERAFFRASWGLGPSKGFRKCGVFHEDSGPAVFKWTAAFAGKGIQPDFHAGWRNPKMTIALWQREHLKTGLGRISIISMKTCRMSCTRYSSFFAFPWRNP